jgi:hypothetical protein
MVAWGVASQATMFSPKLKLKYYYNSLKIKILPRNFFIFNFAPPNFKL